MSAYPVCPVHGLLKPCLHCEPPKTFLPVGGTIQVCGDVYSGSELEHCSCGKYRMRWYGHNYKRVF